ncbi:MAG: TlpA disulfide reductase family protein [Steroidobacteraceae bacterium]
MNTSTTRARDAWSSIAGTVGMIAGTTGLIARTVRVSAGVLALGVLVLSAVASSAAAASGPPAVRMGLYRAVLTLPAGELPVGLDLKREGAATVGYLQNGPERLKLDEVTVAGSHLEIRMPGYENRLIADAKGDELEGEVILVKLGGKQQHIPLHARRGATFRFFETAATDPADVSGRWAVTFTDESGTPAAAVGEFSQLRDTVTGTFLTDTGDHRYLAGQVRGNELYLSTFDGAHAFLYKAKITPEGLLSGDFWSGPAYHEKWSGKRDAHAALPDAYALTNMHSGSKHFDFAFPDLAGKTVTSQDAAFRGKVMIVALAGSWCPNCHDEAAFLEPLYRQYRGKGLEIVSLMFEHFGDFPQAAAATQRFRNHYGIEYTTLIAGISDKDEAAKKLPMLERVYAFPTTVFVDRKGNVRKIHTGFSGPATGAHYTEFVNEVKATLDQLLAES